MTSFYYDVFLSYRSLNILSPYNIVFLSCRHLFMLSPYYVILQLCCRLIILCLCHVVSLPCSLLLLFSFFIMLFSHHLAPLFYHLLIMLSLPFSHLSPPTWVPSLESLYLDFLTWVSSVESHCIIYYPHFIILFPHYVVSSQCSFLLYYSFIIKASFII